MLLKRFIRTMPRQKNISSKDFVQRSQKGNADEHPSALQLIHWEHREVGPLRKTLALVQSLHLLLQLLTLSIARALLPLLATHCNTLGATELKVGYSSTTSISQFTVQPHTQLCQYTDGIYNTVTLITENGFLRKRAQTLRIPEQALQTSRDKTTKSQGTVFCSTDKSTAPF